MSMTLPYDPENIFAKIIKGEIPNTTVYEDDDVLSFMDLFPQSKGHTLVIPKNEQATNLLDISSSGLETLINRVQHISKAVDRALTPDGIRIAQFNGSTAGQTVFHIHFHIIPMWEDQNLGAHAGGQADMAELQELANKIKSAL